MGEELLFRPCYRGCLDQKPRGRKYEKSPEILPVFILFGPKTRKKI